MIQELKKLTVSIYHTIIIHILPLHGGDVIGAEQGKKYPSATCAWAPVVYNSIKVKT